MNGYRASFWVGTIVAALTALLFVCGWNANSVRQFPSKPAFPIPGQNFVAEYSSSGAAGAHYVYYFGLFGFGTKIRDSDVLLLGSSHMQFGLSAEVLATLLSRGAKHPLTVFNMGLGCTEGLDFGAHLLRRVGVVGKTVVVDLFSLDLPPSHCAEEAQQADTFVAYARVAGLWSKFWLDWLGDGTLPRITFSDGAFQVERFLGHNAVILNWNTGDVVEFWNAGRGRVFPGPFTNSDATLDEGTGSKHEWSLHDGAIVAPPMIARVAKESRLEPIFTLVPYRASTIFGDALYQHGLRTYDQVAESVSGPRTNLDSLFIAISRHELHSWDDGWHLTGDSRRLATTRLFEGMSRYPVPRQTRSR